MENPQSWNGYAYALNNPTVNVDPDGLKVKLYDKNRKFIGEIEDEEANAGLFNRDWQRKNGHRVRQGVIYDNDDNVIGYYENTCCDWLAGSSNERVVQQLSSGEAFDRAAPRAILNTVTRGLTRGSTSRRGLWEITKAGTDKVLKHRSFEHFLGIRALVCGGRKTRQVTVNPNGRFIERHQRVLNMLPMQMNMVTSFLTNIKVLLENLYRGKN